jgi:hypothetical protein
MSSGNEQVNPLQMLNDPLFPLYKRARNRLRQCDPESFLGQASEALHEVYSKGIQILHQYQPWNLLLAVKWALQEADALSHRRRRATRSDLHAALNVLHEMEAEVRLPSGYDHVSLFMRQLAFQQFWLQHGPSGEALARQHLLFCSLSRDHYFSREFQRLTGLSCVEFVEFSFALVVSLLGTPTPRLIRRDYFDSFASTLAPGALDAFLGHLSKSIPELHSRLTTSEYREISIADQRIVPSPLLDSPLIRTESGAYMIIFPTLVMRAMERVVYRTLRAGDPAEFGVRFGPIFEKYVGRCLADASVDYRDEDWLQARLSGCGKCVDFLITDDGGSVLIDAKGIEMSRRGRVSQRPDLVLSAIKDSAIKAIEQGMVTSRRIAAASAPEFRGGVGETFLLIVTFDNLFLGSSADFGTIFGHHLLPRLERECGLPLPIPLTNVFFVAIDELERLLALVQQKATTIVEFLRHVRAQDADVHTRKFHFQQHLESFTTPPARLAMLETALDALFKQCMERMAMHT